MDYWQSTGIYNCDRTTEGVWSSSIGATDG